MFKGWNRIETWLTLGVAGIGVILLSVAGLFVYMSATARPLHADPTAISSAAQSTPSEQWNAAVESARRAVRAGIAEQNLPGLSVAVGVGGDIAWAEGFGFADLEQKTTVTPGMRFRIGTASVLLTSAAVGQLLEKGQLKLDDDIRTVVPEFPKTPWPVTLRQIMAHTAGVPSDGGDEGPLFGTQCERPTDAFPHFADRELRFEPGTQYRQSRFGWIVVSAAIEAASREPFQAFMQKQVFAPTGMDNTLADAGVEAIEDRATSYFPKFASDPRYGPDPMRDINLSCYMGASVFMSTASDMVRFTMALANGKLLQPATVQLLQEEQTLTNGEGTGYGLGWDIETVTVAGKPTRSIGHNGDLLGGVAVTVMSLPEHGVVVAALSNTSYADTPALALRIAEAFVSQQ